MQFRVVKVDDIKVPDDLIRKDLGDVEALAAAIAENEVIDPIVVRPDLTLVEGKRRHHALRLLGRATTTVQIRADGDSVAIQCAANTYRKPFTYSEKVEAARRRNELLQFNEQHSQPVPTDWKTDSTAYLAKELGMSKATFVRAKYVVENAPAELVVQLDAGKIEVATAYNKLKPDAAAKAADNSRNRGQGKTGKTKSPEQKRAADTEVAPTAPPSVAGAANASNDAEAAATAQNNQPTPVEVVETQECEPIDQTPAKPGDYYDRFNTPIPGRLKDVFASVAELQSMVKQAEELRDYLKGLSWAKWFRGLSEAYQQQDDIATRLKDTIPYAVHSACEGNGCNDCRGCGWVSEWRYDELAGQAAMMG